VNKGILKIGLLRKRWLISLIRFVGLFILALMIFAAVLLVFGKNPMHAYWDIFSATLGSSYGIS